jgi:ADP-heptose:LPS heptosyltransferase
MSIDWPSVKRILVIRLRSIGDTVVATPSLIALKRFLPNARVDILLDDRVAPVLDGFDSVDEVLTVRNSTAAKLRTIRQIRQRKYHVVFNLHGGPTSMFLTALSGAQHRVGYHNYRGSFAYDLRLSSSKDFWGREETHSAEHQLALLGYLGVPVEDRPRSYLAVNSSAVESLANRFDTRDRTFDIHRSSFALMHPGTAFKTKKWPTRLFARTAEFLYEKGIQTVAVASSNERDVLDELAAISLVPIFAFADLSLPEVTALASRATLFIGNDSGIAHISAAVSTPTVVIFGSSNRSLWYPWTDAPSEMVFEPLPCQPCPGYRCKAFNEPKCILSVRPEAVFAAIDRVIKLAVKV